MLVGAGKGGLVRRRAGSQVHKIARAAGKPIADIAQRIRVCELAEQHCDQLRPATEALGRSFGTVLFTSPANSRTGKCRSS
jgi:hypothetical protein